MSEDLETGRSVEKRKAQTTVFPPTFDILTWIRRWHSYRGDIGWELDAGRWDALDGS